MLNVDYTITYGEVDVKRGDDVYTIKIHAANALCAFIYHYEVNGEKKASLYMFLGDEKHIKNIMDEFGTLFSDEVEEVRLNVFYKESQKLIMPMCKSGYKVVCYYEEPKTNEKIVK